MRKWKWVTVLVTVGMLLPVASHAQGVAGEMDHLHGVLDQLYNDMMPLCSKLIGVGQGIAGFAATWYIASRIWRHIANAEPIDFYPLFRPFVLGFCVMIFPSVLAMINGIMKPTVTATADMVKGSDKAIATLLEQKQEALKKSTVWQMYVGESGEGDRDKWYKYTYNEDPSSESMLGSIGNDVLFGMNKMAYKFTTSIKAWMSEILQILFEAASLCINTLRTFQLVVLAILGPLVFGLAVFDGFQHTLTSWIARYINIFLWLPVANIFGAIIGKVQEKMIALDISQIQGAGDTFFSATDVAYIVFLIIGIIGYFTVPSVANYIIHAGGHGGLLSKVTNTMSTGSRIAESTASGGLSRADGTLRSMGNMGRHYREGYSGDESGAGKSGAIGRSLGRSGAYLADKLSGKS